MISFIGNIHPREIIIDFTTNTLTVRQSDIEFESNERRDNDLYIEILMHCVINKHEVEFDRQARSVRFVDRGAFIDTIHLDASIKRYDLVKFYRNSKDKSVVNWDFLQDFNGNIEARKLARSSQNFLLIDNEKDVIVDALFAFQGSKTDSAAALGITRATLNAKIKNYHLEPELKDAKNAR